MWKCYHLTQKPVRALGWKASAVLASLISHPSLILSVTQSAWLQCSSGLLLHKLGCGLWAQRGCECSGGWSCRYYRHGLEQEPVCRACLGAGASHEAAWEAAICRKPLGSVHHADVAIDRAKDGWSQRPSKGLSTGAEISDFQGWQSLFLFEHSDQLCKGLCYRWTSYSWNYVSSHTNQPLPRG